MRIDKSKSNKKKWQKYINNAKSNKDIYSIRQSLHSFDYDDIICKVRFAVNEIKKKYGDCKFFLFGSFAHKAWLNDKSDIDIAVKGLKPKKFWKAWVLLDSMIDDRVVDFVDIDDLNETFKQVIYNEGIIL